MPNRLQKLIYNLSASSPLFVLFAGVWAIQKKEILIPLIVFDIGLLLIMAFSFSFSYGRKKLPASTIRATEITPYDNWIGLYIFTYGAPFASLAIDDFNFYLVAIIASVIIVCSLQINNSIPNPLLFIRGYHFYQVSTEQGTSGFTVTSKRVLRKANDLTTVQCLSDFLLLDLER